MRRGEVIKFNKIMNACVAIKICTGLWRFPILGGGGGGGGGGMGKTFYGSKLRCLTEISFLTIIGSNKI